MSHDAGADLGSDLGMLADSPAPAQPPAHGRRRAERRRGRGRGCLALTVAFVVLAVALWFGGTWAYGKLENLLADAPDYPGPGSGSVLIEVQEGATSSAIGRTLKDAGVVKSVDAFTAAAVANPQSRNIQVGYYQLKKQMKASDALDVLVDPANLVQAKVTVPEGARVKEIVALLAKKTEIKAGQLRAALKDAGALGLPEDAKGNPEGYLFPATYEVRPDDTAASLLKRMVDRWRQAADDVGLDQAASRLGYTPHQLMTIASLVEAEAGTHTDRRKVARVIYNRLKTTGAPTYGKLEIDATVNYAHGRRLGVALTQADLAIDSPYNTRKYPGLPPGPIGSPGESAIDAAAHPAEGPWLFYVTTNLRTGETKFAATYDEFLRYKAEFQKYCQTSDAC